MRQGGFFYDLEDIFEKGQYDYFDLTLGELIFVSSLSSEKIISKYHIFANSCGSVLKQVQRSVGENLKEATKGSRPMHPIYGLMIYGTTISLQQVIETLDKANEFPDLDQLGQLFVDMVKHWFDRVLIQRTHTDRPPSLYLRRGAWLEASGGNGGGTDALWGQTPAGQGLGSPQLLPSSVPSTTQSAEGGGERLERTDLMNAWTSTSRWIPWARRESQRRCSIS